MITKEKAKELSEILKAYSEGKTIQRKSNTGWNDLHELLGEDIKQATVKVGGEYLDLRIKPEPKLVTFTFEDSHLFLNKVVRWKSPHGGTIMKSIVISCNDDFVWIGTVSSWVSYSKFLNEFEFEDGSSCGKYVE